MELRDLSGSFRFGFDGNPDRTTSFELATAGVNAGDYFAVTNRTVGDGSAIIFPGYLSPMTPWADDDVTLSDGDDFRDAGLGDDTVRGLEGNDTIYGRAGNDWLFGGSNDDVLIGGNGDDNIFGGSFDDVLVGGDGMDMLDGGSGNDYLRGASGRDELYGGSGNDTLVDMEGGDSLHGGDGDDTYKIGDEDSLIFEIEDGGIDTVLTTDSLYALPQNIEILVVTRPAGHNVNAVGNILDNQIFSFDSDDTLRGDRGDDLIDSGGGDDELFGGRDDDTLLGGSGNDRLFGDSGNDVLVGGSGDDSLQGDTRVLGSNDRLFGGAGNDEIDGGFGSDTINGDAGDDTLTGGAGFSGVQGRDWFKFSDDAGQDIITDFHDKDLIVLRDYREENGGAPLDFDQLLITQDGSSTRIELDLDRNGVADLIDLDGDSVPDVWSIELLDTDIGEITASDFVF